MSKAKEKPKKIDPKELELQKQLEEARRREEEERKRQEEMRRYEVIILPTGLKLILTQYCITEAWKNPKPRDFFSDFMGRYFKKNNLSENFESIEVNILAEFHLYNLIFAKEELSLDDYRTTVLLNLLWEILMNGNSNYNKTQNNDVNSPHQSPKLKKSSILFKEKNLVGDYEFFKERLMQHTVEMDIKKPCIKIFNANQAKIILQFVNDGFFSHYRLYENIFNNKQKSEEILISVFIDVPLNIPALSQALYMGKERLEIKDEDEEYSKEIQEKLKKLEAQKKEEEEKKRLEIEKEIYEKSLNSKTMKFIMKNIGEGKENVSHEMKSKEQELEKKVETILNPKKK